MISMQWQTALALFWFGMFVEAGLGNIMGRVSSPDALWLDAAIIMLLLMWAKPRKASPR